MRSVDVSNGLLCVLSCELLRSGGGVVCFYIVSVECSAKKERYRTPDHALCSTVVHLRAG